MNGAEFRQGEELRAALQRLDGTLARIAGALEAVTACGWPREPGSLCPVCGEAVGAPSPGKSQGEEAAE